MGKDYIERLKNPKWQKLRLDVMQRDNFMCIACGDRESTLNVHHKYYKKNFEPWDYPKESLVTLCQQCHEREEKYKQYFDELFFRFKEIFLNTDAEIIHSLLDYIRDEMDEEPLTVFYLICELIYDKDKFKELINYYRDKSNGAPDKKQY